jgi:hypothetical protein
MQVMAKEYRGTYMSLQESNLGLNEAKTNFKDANAKMLAGVDQCTSTMQEVSGILESIKQIKTRIEGIKPDEIADTAVEGFRKIRDGGIALQTAIGTADTEVLVNAWEVSNETTTDGFLRETLGPIDKAADKRSKLTQTLGIVVIHVEDLQRHLEVAQLALGLVPPTMQESVIDPITDFQQTNKLPTE